MQKKQRQAVIIHSPHSGRSDQLTDALTALQEGGIEIIEQHSIAEIEPDSEPGQHWQQMGIDVVIAAGGDGLIGGVASMIASYHLPLGIIPLGTSNNVARAAKIPLDTRQAAECVLSGQAQAFDLGRVQQLQDTKQPEQFFTQALTAGAHVQFSQLATDQEQRQRLGALNYPLAVAETIRDFQVFDVELSFKGLSRATTPQQEATLQCRAAQITIANAGVFGGALEATLPGDDSLHDRLLDIVVIEDDRLDLLLLRTARFFSRSNYVSPPPDDWHSQYPDLLSAQLTDIAGIHHVRARAVSVTTPGPQQDVALDGEVCLQTPILAQIASERLMLIVPV